MTEDMATKNQKSAFIEISKLSSNSINDLVDRFGKSLVDGESYIENSSDGFRLRIISNVEDKKIDGVKSIGDMFFPLVTISEFFIHEIEKEEELSAENLDLPDITNDKLKTLWKKLHETGALEQIDYQIHTIGERLIGATVFTSTKFIKMYNTSRYHQCADIVLEINTGENKKNFMFELDKLNLKLLINQLQYLEKEMDNSTINLQVRESNE